MSTRDIYDDIRPTLFLSKIFVLTSLQNTFSGQPIFRWGYSIVYLIIVYTGILYVTVFANVQRNRTPIMWYWTFNSVMREICRQTTATYADSQVPVIIAKMYRFDLEQRRNLQYRSTSRHLIGFYCIFQMGMVICTVIDLNNNGVSLDNMYSAFFRYWTSLFPIMYLFFCDQLYLRFRAVELRLTSEVTKLLMATPLQATPQTMELERLAHAQLCDLTKDVRSAFGPLLTTYVVFVFLEHLARFYSLAYFQPLNQANNPNTKPSDRSVVEVLEPLLFIAHSWTGIYLVAHYSGKLTQSSKLIIVNLRSIPLWKLPKDCVDQVILFIVQVETSNTIIRPLGLFTMNKSIISSMIMALFTYIIVVVQLSSGLISLFEMST